MASSALSARCSAATTDSPGSSSDSSGSSAPIAGEAGIGRRVRAFRSICSTSRTTSSSVACTASRQEAERCARSPSAVTRAMSSSATTARIDSRAARASLAEASSWSAFTRSPRHHFVGRPDLVLECLQRPAHSHRARPAPPRPRHRDRRHAGGSIELFGQHPGTHVELRSCFLEPPHLGFKRGGAFDERGMRGAALGSAAVQVLGGVARVEQTALRHRQALVGRALVVLQAARSIRGLRPDGDRARRAPLRPDGARAPAARPSGPAASLRRRRAAAGPRRRRQLSPAGGARRSARRSRSTPARSSPRARRSPRASRNSASRSPLERARAAP